MRRIAILCMALAMSAFAFTNCAYPDWEPVPSTGEPDGSDRPTVVLPTVTDFSVVASIAQTKSEISEEGALVWSAGDLINVFHGVSGEAALVSDGVVFFNPKSDTPNEFLGKLGKDLKDGYTYDWYVFYPYNEELAIVNNTAPVIIGSKAEKSQIQDGYGSKSHVSGDYMPMFGTATGVEQGKTPRTELSHLASVIELNIASCMPDPVEITEVKVTAGEAIVGSFVVDFVKGTVTAVDGASSNTASLTIKNPTAVENGQTEKFYLVVKPFTAKASDGLTITVNGGEKKISLNEDLVFAPGKVTSIDYTYYDVAIIKDSLLGCFKIKTMWVYGGAGPMYGGGGWVDLHNKTWWFDEGSGHGIKSERDNYLEFTLTDLLDGGSKLTGKCVNWAGVDGKNWSCFFHNASINEGDPTDARNFYRKIPVGESTWVRDYAVTPNTVTFTDSYGNVTVVEIYDQPYEFTVDHYNDSNAAANKRTFPRTAGDDMTFHAKLTGRSDNWDYHYSEVDKIYWNPRDFFIDVDRVDEIPAEAKTYEKPYDPTDQYPESIAGTYKYSTDFSVGGKDGNITVKGLIAQFDSDQSRWTEPLTGDGTQFNLIIRTIQNDVYTFTATGIDEKQNEVGTVTFDDGGDGTWEYQLMDNTQARPYPVTDATELYGFIAHDSTTKYVYDRAARTITFTTRGKEYVVKYLVPGKYTYDGKEVQVSSTFGMHYNQGYTEARVANYSNPNNGFARHYVWSRHYILCLERQ